MCTVCSYRAICDLLACVLCVESFWHGGDLLACVLYVEPFGHGGNLLACTVLCVEPFGAWRRFLSMCTNTVYRAICNICVKAGLVWHGLQSPEEIAS